MKKIWVINHYAVPPELGTFVRQFQFAKALKEKYDFEIFTSSQIHNSDINIKENKKFIKTLYYDGIKFNFIRNIDYGKSFIKRAINMLEFAFKILFLSSKKYGKPDTVYLSSPCLIASFFGLIVGKIKKAKIITEVRDIWPYSIVDYSEKITKYNIVIHLLSMIEKLIYVKSDAIIFTVPGGKEYIKDRGWDKKISESKVFYINNGVDLNEFKKSIVELNDVDLQSQKKKIIYTGSIRKANNVLTLVKAFEKVGKDALLLLYGSGDEVPEIEAYILNNGIKNIKYKGRVEKKMIPSILSKGDFNILTYLPIKDSLVNKYGSSQNKLFEYLASEKPIISNQKYGEYDIIDFYKCGLVKQCDTIEEYEELINKALTLSKEEYEEFHKNTQKMIQKFDWKNLSEELEKIFQYINNV